MYLISWNQSVCVFSICDGSYFVVVALSFSKRSCYFVAASSLSLALCPRLEFHHLTRRTYPLAESQSLLTTSSTACSNIAAVNGPEKSYCFPIAFSSHFSRFDSHLV